MNTPGPATIFVTSEVGLRQNEHTIPVSGLVAAFLTPPHGWGPEIRCFLRDPMAIHGVFRWRRAAVAAVVPRSSPTCVQVSSLSVPW